MGCAYSGGAWGAVGFPRSVSLSCVGWCLSRRSAPGRGCSRVARGCSRHLEGVIDEGRAGVKAGQVLPPLTAEGVVGAAFSVIYARLLERRAGASDGLLNALMAIIVLPYRGHAVARRELARLPDFAVSQAGRDFSGR